MSTPTTYTRSIWFDTLGKLVRKSYDMKNPATRTHLIYMNFRYRRYLRRGTEPEHDVEQYSCKYYRKTWKLRAAEDANA